MTDEYYIVGEYNNGKSSMACDGSYKSKGEAIDALIGIHQITANSQMMDKLRVHLQNDRWIEWKGKRLAVQIMPKKEDINMDNLVASMLSTDTGHEWPQSTTKEKLPSKEELIRTLAETLSKHGQK